MKEIDIHIPDSCTEEDVRIIQLVLDQVPEITELSDDGIDALADVLFQINYPEVDDNQFE